MIDLKEVLKNKRILIVDDLVDARSSLKKMMTSLGATQIETANDGREASQYVIENNYDIILADYNLGPGKDGQQILEEARYSRRLKASALFIMVTGESNMEMVMGALEYEPDSYITKPFTQVMLQERLTRILQIKMEFKDINAAIDAHNPKLAIELAERLLKQKPKLLISITKILGRLYMEIEDYQAAKDAYEHLLKTRPVVWAYLGQAICLHHLGESLQALAIINDTSRKHPMYVQCYDWEARIALSLGNTQDAQAALEKAIQYSPKAVLRQQELGNIALANNDLTVAEKAFTQAINLGRFSCYKSSDSYLKYAETAQKIIQENNGTNSKSIAFMTEKTIRLLEEVKQDYSKESKVIFDANISISNTYLALGKEDLANQAMEAAQHHLQDLITPDYQRQVVMAETFVKGGQHVQAKKVLNKVDTDNAPEDITQKVQSVSGSLAGEDVRAYIRELNTQGIELYAEQKFVEAIKIFDEAVANKEATKSVLMNAIQTKISYIEQHGFHIDYLKDCYNYFKRIGKIEESDQRFPRYNTLRTTFTKLWQSANNTEV